MAERLDTGIQIVAAPTRDQAISFAAEPIAAFIGRCLCGPVNQPYVVQSLSEFERIFGGRWRVSGLASSLAQFFAHGGRKAVIVRVANNATGASIEMPTDGEPIVLRALNPGSAEKLRIAVDYDGLGSDDMLFNLVVQRMDQSERLIADQEIFESLSPFSAHEDFIGTRLQNSRLVRLQNDTQSVLRARATKTGAGSSAVEYISIARRGKDGDSLSDYDLVGSQDKRTGLFALDAAEHFDFIYAPVRAAGVMPGPAFLMAAERYCERRNAMLVVDPPSECQSVQQMLAHRNASPFRSGNMLTYYPSVRARDGQKSGSSMSAAGAIIGMMCRSDERHHVWSALADINGPNSAALQRDWLAAEAIDADDAIRLLRTGVNPLLAGRQRRVLFPGLVSMAAGADKRTGSLPLHRLTKFILRHIGRGTRWAVFEPPSEQLWQRVGDQVSEFMGQLAEQGAFSATRHSPGWLLRCDEATNALLPAGQNGVRLMVGFRAQRSFEPIMYTLTQTNAGTSVHRAAFEQLDRAI